MEEFKREVLQRLARIENLIVNNTSNNKINTIEKLTHIIKLVNDTAGGLTVNTVMDEFSVSKPYALELMKKADKQVENVIFIPGNPGNPSFLQLVNSMDKIKYVPLLIMRDLKGRIGATKTLGGLMKQYELSKEECMDVVSSLIRFTNQRVGIIGEDVPYAEKRLKNWRLK